MSKDAILRLHPKEADTLLDSLKHWYEENKWTDDAELINNIIERLELEILQKQCEKV